MHIPLFSLLHVENNPRMSTISLFACLLVGLSWLPNLVLLLLVRELSDIMNGILNNICEVLCSLDTNIKLSEMSYRFVSE